MKIDPLDDRLLVEPELAAEQRTQGGLYIPETAREKPRTARVVAVGTDDDLREKVKVDDRVLYGKYGGDEFELEGRKYLVLYGKYGGDEFELEGRKYLVLQRSEVLAVLRS